MTSAEQDYNYSLPDTHALYHTEDEVLSTMKVDLPDLTEFYSKHLRREIKYEEAITLVDGYGLPTSEQYFRYTKLPEKVRKLYLNVSKKRNIPIKQIKQEMLYEELDDNKLEYKSEILFIEREIFRRYNGYWFYNNGKPTFITGWHYFFLNYWKLNNSGENDNLPYYRDKQRRQFLFYDWAIKTKEKKYSHRVSFRKNGVEDVKYFNDNASAREFAAECNNGGYAMVDVGLFIQLSDNRTVHGITQPKTRREGYTATVCCMMFCIITERQQMNAWILGLTDDDARDKIFKKSMVEPIYKLPFFFQPFHDNEKYIKPSDAYNFTYPHRLQLKEISGELPQSIGSTIKPFANVYRNIDGTRAGVIYKDECGKTNPQGNTVDVELWWTNVAMRTLEFGNKLVGFAMLGSTVGDMAGGGGEAYNRLCSMSHDHTRNNNGTTISGLVNLFFPAYDGMEGFIDKHGMSVIHDPVTPVFDISGKQIKQGAKSYLKNKRDGYLKDGNIQAYINETREMPWSWTECWTPSANNSNFPIMEMRKRHAEIIFTKGETSWGRYRLEWVNNQKFGAVELVPDDSGEWVFLKPFLKRINPMTLNRKVYNHYDKSWEMDMSVANRIVCGVDPFRYDDASLSNKKGKKSKGAIAVYYPYDEKFDYGRLGDEQISDDYVAFYNSRPPTKEEFTEELVKLMIFLGCHVNMEKNEISCYEKLVEWKFQNYMLHRLDIDGYETDVRGQQMDEKKKQDLFAKQELFFKRHIHRTKLPHIIDAWMKIPSPKHLTDHDLCAASAWALDGVRNLVHAKEETTSQFGWVLPQSF